MKSQLLAVAVAIGLVGMSSSAFAVGGKENQPMPPMFGPVVEMEVGGHMMHLQMIEDANGGQWVVMSREDAEQLLGESLGKTKFTKFLP